MIDYVEAPHYKVVPNNRTLFLAGGISGCRDWQVNLINGIQYLPRLTVYNPRRAFFINKDEDAKEQITWEFNWLELCEAIVFWFSYETVQPIVLLEFGRWTASKKKLFIGCDSQYVRKSDVKIQLGLIRPKQVLHNNLDSLVEEIKREFA